MEIQNSVEFIRFHFFCVVLLCKGEGALCKIPIENILAVERLEEESFKMKNVRDSVAHTRTHRPLF